MPVPGPEWATGDSPGQGPRSRHQIQDDPWRGELRIGSLAGPGWSRVLVCHAALSGLASGRYRFPRASPWAISFGPFRAERWTQTYIW